jgi:O-antigen/teichoic acid export membrane protein
MGQVRGAATGAAPAIAPRADRLEIWCPVVAAMGKTGAASVLSGCLSALATKIIAVMAGPAAVALLATLQQTRQMALVAATGNGQTALVQGASAFHGEQRREYLRTVAWLFLSATVLVTLALAGAPRLVQAVAGLPSGTESLLEWLAIPVALSAVFVFLSAMLNALGGIGRLGVLQVAASLAMALGAWVAARSLIEGRVQGVVYLLAVSAAVSVFLAAGLLARDAGELWHWFCGPGRLWAGDAARHFISISGAMLISGLASTAVLLWVRRRITASQGLAVTGQFDAAWNISMNHVTVVLSSLQTYFLPALARTRGEGRSNEAERNARISSVLTVAALAATAVIAALALAKPWALVLFYSSAFRPAAAYLRWTLVGDYLKVAGWILSIPILAAADMKVFLTADLAALGVFLAASAGSTRWMSAAESAGAAFVLMHAAHLAICASYVHGRYGYRPSRLAAAVWVGGLAVVGLASVFAWDLA